MYLAVQLQKEVHHELCSPRCCSRFPRAMLIRLVGNKLFLRPVLVDLVDHFASSILIQTAVLSESSVLFGRGHLSSSCIPLSLCKQLVVCRRGRLHATLSGKTAILPLSEFQIAQIYCILMRFPSIFGLVKAHGTILGFVKSHEVFSHNFHLPSGSIS